MKQKLSVFNRRKEYIAYIYGEGEDQGKFSTGDTESL